MEIKLAEGEAFNVQGGDGLKVNGQEVGGAPVVVDDTLTQDGENPVKSKGIWSAIWGAIAAPAASVYAWVTTELGKKQDKLSDTQMAAVDSGITAEKVSKLDGVEAGAQKNPDLSGYAKNNDVLPRYPFGNADWVEGETEGGYGVYLYFEPYQVSLYDASNSDASLVLIDYRSGGVSTDKAKDFVLIIDVPEDREITFYWLFDVHPRGGDAANLEVVAGKRNVFFITEVQLNEFMVARDELALPEEEGGE